MADQTQNVDESLTTDNFRFSTGAKILIEVINHHAPRTPKSTQPTGLFKRASEGRVVFFKRAFSGEEAIANFKSHFKLAALADITVNLPRKNYTKRDKRKNNSKSKITRERGRLCNYNASAALTRVTKVFISVKQNSVELA